MSTVNEFCPRCLALREMRISEMPSEKVAADGKTKRVVIRSFHCVTCRNFVRSETVEALEK